MESPGYGEGGRNYTKVQWAFRRTCCKFRSWSAVPFAKLINANGFVYAAFLLGVYDTPDRVAFCPDIFRFCT